MKTLFFAILIAPYIAYSGEEIKCGVASGFPPYQYTNDKGEVTGIDVEIAKLVFKTAGIKAVFISGEWDFFISNLVHNTGAIDMLVGAEFNERRSQFMDFSTPLHLRRTNLFVLKDSSYSTIESLYGKVVAGDQDSMFEKNLADKKNNIRIITTTSKEDSFNKLKEQLIVGAIAPELVASYFSKKMNIKIKAIGPADQGANVSMTVKKGNKVLLDKINAAIKELKKTKKIEQIISKYETH